MIHGVRIQATGAQRSGWANRRPMEPKASDEDLTSVLCTSCTSSPLMKSSSMISVLPSITFSLLSFKRSPDHTSKPTAQSEAKPSKRGQLKDSFQKVPPNLKPKANVEAPSDQLRSPTYLATLQPVRFKVSCNLSPDVPSKSIQFWMMPITDLVYLY